MLLKLLKRNNLFFGHNVEWIKLNSIRRNSKQSSFYNAAKLVQNGNNIISMVGAGLSTPSGIPDFRSPDTGLYHNLQQYNLPYPEAIFDIHFFMMDPRPFFTLAQDLYPGVNYKPNIGHIFLRLLNDKRKLLRLYTQNIDGLERLIGIQSEKLIEAHGTFSTASCTLCGKSHDAEDVKRNIIDGKTPIICQINHCKGKVKPDIVFFGENLPDNFWNYKTDAINADLLLVIGTSLEVYPFAGIADYVGVPRILVNRDSVGSFGTRETDLVLTGDFTKTIEELINYLGWEEDLKLIQNQISTC